MADDKNNKENSKEIGPQTGKEFLNVETILQLVKTAVSEALQAQTRTVAAAAATIDQECGKMGHYARKCQVPGRDSRKKRKKDGAKQKYVTRCEYYQQGGGTRKYNKCSDVKVNGTEVGGYVDMVREVCVIRDNYVPKLKLICDWDNYKDVTDYGDADTSVLGAAQTDVDIITLAKRKFIDLFFLILKFETFIRRICLRQTIASVAVTKTTNSFLATSSESIPNLAQMADKIAKIPNISSVCTVATLPNDMSATIQKLTKEVAALKAAYNTEFKTRRQRSRPQTPDLITGTGVDSRTLCIPYITDDYRRLNTVTKEDRYPIPHLHDFGHLLAIWLPPDPSRSELHPKTAIITPFGLFEFTRMQFALPNSAQSFQRFIHEVSNGLDFCFPYLIDILIASTGLSEHSDHPRKVFERLLKYGLIINPEKCSFGNSVSGL
ncbi:hypothetical protein TcasGA2_TC010691 [Tribolium castaneum]|uniref:Reverse transcriptase domain-containing protein n=1 Tax=Tribolium castaneum TaxID=7070 RepID=D2CG41_TRICA|nr:hypothetical protein TcasGA2_TC010691 [Tribolium castaneum]